MRSFLLGLGAGAILETLHVASKVRDPAGRGLRLPINYLISLQCVPSLSRDRAAFVTSVQSVQRLHRGSWFGRPLVFRRSDLEHWPLFSLNCLHEISSKEQRLKQRV